MKFRIVLRNGKYIAQEKSLFTKWKDSSGPLKTIEEAKKMIQSDMSWERPYDKKPGDEVVWP